MTIDDLARQAQLPVRTIREYHTMRLLPPPERRGRVGYYGPGHAHRLELITRLQGRGYSLAGISDMLNLAGTLRRELSSLADTIADLIADRLLPALQDRQNTGELVPLLQRG